MPRFFAYVKRLNRIHTTDLHAPVELSEVVQDETSLTSCNRDMLTTLITDRVQKAICLSRESRDAP